MPDPIDRAAVLLTEDPSEAVAAARKAAGSGGLILVAGSLYLIGEIRRLLLSA
jgi:folylpolyglutamate synthase/dihydropteroate synthase